MIRALAVVVVVLASARAEADAFVSVGLGLGGAIRTTAADGVALGIRPEVVWARSTHYPSFGVGGFAELATAEGTTRDSLAGAGVTALVYGGTMSAALSLGGDLHWFGDANPVTPVASLFLGVRSPDDDGPHDEPFGLRIDFRPGSGAMSRSTTVSVVIDVWTIATAVEYTAAVIYGLTHSN